MAFLKFLFLFLLVVKAEAQTTTPNPWPERVWSDLSREVDNSGTALTNVIFEELDNFDFNQDYKGVVGGIGVRRTVLDNQDVMNTWTVNDEIHVDITRNATEYSFPLIPSVTSPVSLNLGIGGQLKVNHIRQVPATKYHELPTIESVKEDINSDQKLIESHKNSWFDFDPSMRPRFSRLWNPILNFYRIPWTKDGLHKVGNGELVSYASSGFVSVGLESGIVPIKLAKGVDLSVGVGTQVFLKGEFRITLLKENERYVRVKLSRMRSAGGGATVGAKTSQIQIYEGFMLFEGQKLESNVLPIDITVIPFKFSWDYENKKSYTLGFRYDLADPEAEEAFEKAMRGNFSFSTKVAVKNKAITHILTRHAIEKKNSRTLRLGTDWLVDWKKGKHKSSQWILLERPQGTDEIFKTSVELSKTWSTVWGVGEKKNFLFTVVYDQTGSNYQLVTEVLYEDVRTSAKEMQRYIHDVKQVIGDEDILPELPLLVPADENGKMRKASYRRSSFYFGQYFSKAQIIKFLKTPEKEANNIAIKCFASARKAEAFVKRWMNLQERFSPPMNKDEMTKALEDLRTLFKNQQTAISSLSAIKATLNKEQVDYFLTATNNTFGRIQFRGRTTTNAERLLQMADETLEFENKLGNLRPNPEAQIKDFKAQQVNDHINASFIMPSQPKFLFFKVLRTSGWKRIKTIKEFVYLNAGKFIPGTNLWVISPKSTDRLDREILDAIKESDFYTVQISSSPDRMNWGSITSSRFKFQVIPHTKKP